ncbi:hypothetical protein Scep_029166 [Stephania cephalantha]|uniref:Tetratricopeptide repeat (TPR)-like superfamily protein n=1 Tax=Stephania cephalantha TaxID=152367 RepID=A0AAP0HHB1_9MAGN
MSATGCCMHIKGLQLEKLTLYGCIDNQDRRKNKIICSNSRGNRGFGPRPTKKEKKHAKASLVKWIRRQRQEAPDLFGRSDGKSTNKVLDRQFEERLEAVRRSALEQKKVEETKQFGPIDYDEPVDSNQSTIGLGTKIGVGVAVVVFGLVFALGDFLPSGSVDPSDEAPIADKKLTDAEKSTLKARLQEFEAKLDMSPEDLDALEGAAVTLSELGEYGRAASLLEKLSKEKPRDPDVYRLLGEVKYELKDYEGSTAAYKSAASVSETVELEVLRGLTNSLLAAKKPDEAVQVLLASRERLNTENSNKNNFDSAVTSGNEAKDSQKIDPIQVELLLGKAYSDWGHVSDAVSVYDQLISKYPNDFRGYLAKGIILKENGKVGEAERNFIQARFFAPEKAKLLVDRYAKR